MDVCAYGRVMRKMSTTNGEFSSSFVIERISRCIRLRFCIIDDSQSEWKFLLIVVSEMKSAVSCSSQFRVSSEDECC